MNGKAPAISPLWWPALAVASPVLAPLMAARNARFRRNRVLAAEMNEQRLAAAQPLDLPELEFLEITVLVEHKTLDGFLGDAGVSYLLTTDRGSMLFDVAMGPSTPTLAHNAARLGLTFDDLDAVAMSHLHFDHMGGMAAYRANRVAIPEELRIAEGTTCYVPAPCSTPGLRAELVDGPRLLEAGIATTGPLARSLFMFGLTEEHALVARVRGKGLVILTGCGHPTIELIVRMVRRLSDEPIHAIGGGLHFPLTSGRVSRAGIELQRVVGTGKPPWSPVNDADLSATIAAIESYAPDRVLLSAHDSCDHALARMSEELSADAEVLHAGDRVRIEAAARDSRVVA